MSNVQPLVQRALTPLLSSPTLARTVVGLLIELQRDFGGKERFPHPHEEPLTMAQTYLKATIHIGKDIGSIYPQSNCSKMYSVFLCCMYVPRL